MKIYTAGLIAYETALSLYEENRERFASRFPHFFLREFEKLSEESASGAAFLDNICIEKNTKTSYSRGKFYFAEGSEKAGASDTGSSDFIYIREIAEGGIFAALWQACEDVERIRNGSPAGCRVQLLGIPIDQHVVELLEYAKENPYEVSSSGSFLILCSEEAAAGKGWSAIGEITSEKARVLVAGEKVRYLTPPARQEKDMKDRRQGNAAKSRCPSGH